MTARPDQHLPLNIALCWIMWVLIVINWHWGGLRFTSARLNVLTVALEFLLPALSLLLLYRLPRSRARTRATVVLWLPAAISTLVSLCAMISAVNLSAFGDGMTLLQTVRVGGPPVRVYAVEDQVGGGDSFVIQQERPLFSDLIWVTDLYYGRYTGRVVVEPVDNHHVRCTTPPLFEGEKPETVVLETVR